MPSIWLSYDESCKEFSQLSFDRHCACVLLLTTANSLLDYVSANISVISQIRNRFPPALLWVDVLLDLSSAPTLRLAFLFAPLGSTCVHSSCRHPVQTGLLCITWHIFQLLIYVSAPLYSWGEVRELQSKAQLDLDQEKIGDFSHKK